MATTFINLCLAYFVYFKNRKSWINISFSLFALSAGLWALTNAISLKVETLGNAIFWSQVSYLSAVFIGATFLYLSLVFPAKVSLLKRLGPKKYHKNFLAITIPLISIVIFLPEVTVKTVIIHPWKIITGPGLYLFAIYFLGIIGWGFVNLIKKFLIAQNKERLQLIYLFLGIILAGIGGSFFNLILPLLNDYRFVFLGSFFTFIMIGFITYAIIRQELFGIKVVLTSFLVGLIAVLLAVDLFVFTPQLSVQIFKGLALMIFLFFGRLLIKSVLREIKQKEILEQRVEERTKELKGAKDIAEKRAAELERWYKVTVGREVRMAELKKEIKQLEEKLEKK